MLDLYVFQDERKAEREERDRILRQRALWAEREPAGETRRMQGWGRGGRRRLARALLSLADRVQSHGVQAGGHRHPACPTLNGTA